MHNLCFQTQLKLTIKYVHYNTNTIKTLKKIRKFSIVIVNECEDISIYWSSKNSVSVEWNRITWYKLEYSL